MNKKEKILEVLKKIYDDTSFINDEEISQVIELCDKQLEKDRYNYHVRRDERNYALTEEIRILKSIFEVIRINDRLSFSERYRLEQYYEQELESILNTMYTEEMKNTLPTTTPVYSFDSDFETKKDNSLTVIYSDLPEYSSTLADMCADQMISSQPEIIESKEKKITLPSLEKYKKIESSLKGVGVGYNGNVSVSEESKIIATQTTDLISETEKKNIEIEQQQKEIEIINLQQEINKIENEKLEIVKRIRTISGETIGSYYSQKFSERYPEEYQKFQQYRAQVRNYSSNTLPISDLKEKFTKLSEDLQFYKGILPTYETYYQKYEEVKQAVTNENRQQRVSQNEQKRIYNLIHSAENERLKRSHSSYTAWDLGNKTIPVEYQGMTYEQVETIINEKQTKEKTIQDEKAIRDALIGKTIRKSLMVSDDYHLSQIQIQNLSSQFAGYSNEELQEFINDGKKQETISEVPKQPIPEVQSQPIPYIQAQNTISQDPNYIQAVQQKKNQLINNIIGAMLDVGEFHNYGIDISQKTNDIEYAKRQLATKSIEELELALATYTPQEEVKSSGEMHR